MESLVCDRRVPPRHPCHQAGSPAQRAPQVRDVGHGTRRKRGWTHWKRRAAVPAGAPAGSRVKWPRLDVAPCAPAGHRKRL